MIDWKIGSAAFLVLAAVLILGAGSALAQVPGPDELGVSENDVRDEPSAPKDDNGFLEVDPFFSPKDEALVLDAYVEHGTVLLQEDLSNIRRRAVHGDDYDAGERHMFPGPNAFEAWWGWWSDTGGGGQLQEQSAASGLPGVGEANGAIDESNDCNDDTWDEFTWRGDNPCAEQDGHESYPGDTVLAFVQPGTHKVHFASLPVPGFASTMVPPSPLHNDTDSSQVPDFHYNCAMTRESQACRTQDGWSRIGYDKSLLITTQVVSAVNPQKTGTLAGHTSYDPYSGAPTAGTHAVDQDFYSALAPEVEDAYRTTVWDPEQDYGDEEDEENALAPLHEGGLKQFVKEDGAAALAEAHTTAQTTAGSAVAVFGPQVGLAYDMFFGPRLHEPNHPDDAYNGWATYDADTSYGGLDDDYYEPGSDQTYTGYQEAEHTWLDTTSGVDTCPVLNFCYHGWAHFGPAVPSTSAPVQDAADRGDQRSMGPGFLYVQANMGTWYDANGDTWVGAADEGSVTVPGRQEPALFVTEDGDPYANGLIQDPNQYDSDEFRPICKADFSVTLRSNLDSDGDGVGEWGTTGVYVVPAQVGVGANSGTAYGHVLMDVVGDDAQPVGDAVRDAVGPATIVAPDDENGRLSRYRVQGPIEIDMRAVPTTCPATGSWDPGHRVLFPTGNPGYSITVTTEATGLEHQDSLHGTNEGADLWGESITDVDVLHPNQDEVQGQPIFPDHPLGNNPGGS